MKKRGRKIFWIIICSMLVVVVAIVLAVYAVINLAQSLDVHTEQETIYYTENYPEIYKEELEIIFGSDYEIGEKQTVFWEGEYCDACGINDPPVQFYEWEITYYDEAGQEIKQLLTNKDDLAGQQFGWLKEQLKQHYKWQYLYKGFDDGTWLDLSMEDDGSSYCFVFIEGPINTSTPERKEECDVARAAGRDYIEGLLDDWKNKEKMVHLYELDYGTVFNDYPIRLAFSLNLNNEGLTGKEKEEFETEVNEKIQKMIENMIEESNGTCNLTLFVRCPQGDDNLYQGAGAWDYDVIRGEILSREDYYDDYDWMLYYAYEGILW